MLNADTNLFSSESTIVVGHGTLVENHYSMMLDFLNFYFISFSPCES
jgi:hypothetical protein